MGLLLLGERLTANGHRRPVPDPCLVESDLAIGRRHDPSAQRRRHAHLECPRLSPRRSWPARRSAFLGQGHRTCVYSYPYDVNDAYDVAPLTAVTANGASDAANPLLARKERRSSRPATSGGDE